MGIIFGRDQLELRLSLCFYFGASRRVASVFVFTFLSPDPGVVGHMDAASPADGFTFWRSRRKFSTSPERGASRHSRHRRWRQTFLFVLAKKMKKMTCRSHLTIMGSRQRLLHISRYSQRDHATSRRPADPIWSGEDGRRRGKLHTCFTSADTHRTLHAKHKYSKFKPAEKMSMIKSDFSEKISTQKTLSHVFKHLGDHLWKKKMFSFQQTVSWFSATATLRNWLELIEGAGKESLAVTGCHFKFAGEPKNLKSDYP